MSQELVTFIVLGSKARLRGTKLPLDNKYEEYIHLNFDLKKDIQKNLDNLITISPSSQAARSALPDKAMVKAAVAANMIFI